MAVSILKNKQIVKCILQLTRSILNNRHIVWIVLLFLVGIFLIWRTSHEQTEMLPILNTLGQTDGFKSVWRAHIFRSQTPRDFSFYNIIQESEAMMFESCKNINKTASTEFSTISRADSLEKIYKLGEDIRATITVYNGYGKRKYTGGDHFRAIIENKEIAAKAPCVVTDNRNGTHSILCEALWSGTSNIYVQLAYARETVSIIYGIYTKVLSLWNIYAVFDNKVIQERTVCHPNHTHLQRMANYTRLCNMTYLNSGLPFYCGKPNNITLLCHEWQFIQTPMTESDIPLTHCDAKLLLRGKRTLKNNLTVVVEKEDTDKEISILEMPSIPCSEYNVSLLWNSRRPAGFSLNGTWTLRNCKGVNDNSFNLCLQNKRMYIIGDSTAKAWYSTIVKRLSCKTVTGKSSFRNWHRDTECYNKEYNYTVGWYPHCQPFVIGSFLPDSRYTLYSTTRRLEAIPRNEHAIVIINVYIHLLFFHHSVFKQKMHNIRRGVETFLLKNKHSIVMIKGPHSFETYKVKYVSDYFGYLYSKILYEIFDGLHDNVVFLNNRDSTLVHHNKEIHPPIHIVNDMVDQMFSYACPNKQSPIVKGF